MLTVDFSLFPISSGDRVLDAGCGQGRHSFEVYRLNHCLLFAMDIDEDGLHKLRYVWQFMDAQQQARGSRIAMKGDVLHLPFKDASFDKIICSEVLEHVTDDDQGIGELVRVLKEGGAMVVTVPTFLSETICWNLSEEYHTNPGGHIRIYQAHHLVRALRRHNLSVYAIRQEHSLQTVYWVLRCIFGVRNEQARIPALFNAVVSRGISIRSRFMRFAETIGNYFFPKSLVIYTRKDSSGRGLSSPRRGEL